MGLEGSIQLYPTLYIASPGSLAANDLAASPQPASWRNIAKAGYVRVPDAKES